MSLNAAVPNTTATVTAVATASARCGFSSSTQVNGSYSNSALIAMGISSVTMTGPVFYNNDIAVNPPHNGSGDGTATVTQMGVCVVVCDSDGVVSVSPSYTNSWSTVDCKAHAE